MNASSNHKDCPLSDPEIGIISENDHRVGNCLCEHCTCGIHRCPYYKPRSYLPYVSNYRANYSPKPFDRPLKQPEKSYIPSQQKMDLNTTNHTDFVAYSLPNKILKKPVRQTRRLEMVSKSAYNSDFANWGAYSIPRVR